MSPCSAGTIATCTVIVLTALSVFITPPWANAAQVRHPVLLKWSRNDPYYASHSVGESSGFAGLTISDNGQVGGSAGSFPAVWIAGRTVYLPLPAGADAGFVTGLDGMGHAVGQIRGRNVSLAVRWSMSRRRNSVSILRFPDHESGFVIGMNRSLTAVGFSVSPLGDHVIVWRGFVAHLLSTPDGCQSTAISIDDEGDIVGTWQASGNSVRHPEDHPCVWDGSGRLRALPVELSLDAMPISSRGPNVIVGRFLTPDYRTLPFVLRDGAFARLPLPLGYSEGSAVGVSANGAIVGRAYRTDKNGAESSIAVEWANSIPVDLNLISRLRSGEVLNRALAITAAGRILCRGHAGKRTITVVLYPQS